MEGVGLEHRPVSQMLLDSCMGITADGGKLDPGASPPIARWTRRGSLVVAVDASGSETVPSAIDVVRVLLDGEHIDGLPAAPADDLDGVEFSTVRCKVRLVITTAGSPARLQAFAEANLGGSWTRVCPAVAGGHDHVLVDRTWYPLDAGAVAELASACQTLDILLPAVLPVDTYIKLVSRSDLRWVIEDRAAGTFTPQDVSSRTSLGALPDTLRLYAYQEDGLRWLRLLNEEGIGGILADEMGLGKTVQVIALLASHPERPVFPALIVCPASVLENWRRELAKFAPGISAMVHQGHGRTGDPAVLGSHEVVITSYDTVVRDLSLLRGITWAIIVADEAQNIKNPEAVRTRSLKGLHRATALAVTGTPLENRLSDLWSLADFVIPGVLGDAKSFASLYEAAPEGPRQVGHILRPVMLRRRVSDVANDLPELIDIPHFLEMGEEEADAYERLRLAATAGSGRPTLGALTRLRMFCTYPGLADTGAEWPEGCSMKHGRLMELLEEITVSGEKALIFTSFTKAVTGLVAELPDRFGVPAWSITGDTPVSSRQDLVDRFSAVGGSAILVLNPRAGGVGLNITAANHVIHLNSEWNPALQDQATKRAHRHGQQKPVRVHRLVYGSTVEEVIENRLASKRAMADDAVRDNTGEDADFGDLLRALQVSPRKT